MRPADIDRVFGRSRLRMVTGDHVEVFREAARPGERRRYTKRFLATAAGDFRPWTEREWRILARLVGHGIGAVPDVVQFDRGAIDRPALVQTYDAGITVDHWVTLLPVERGGHALRHVFEDCAHWWALAHHALIALDAIHALQLVHLDLKGDNVCIPHGPADFDPHGTQPLVLRFEKIALIDFAFSLVSGEPLAMALPIARQTEYAYQSPRLLKALEAGARGELAPTRELDWRCDLFSLAAMLRRYLPHPDDAIADAGWTTERHERAHRLLARLLDAHDEALPALRPHAQLIALAGEPLHDADLAVSLQRGWTLARERPAPRDGVATPITRIARPVGTAAAAGATAANATTSDTAAAATAANATTSDTAATAATADVDVEAIASDASQVDIDPLAIDPSDVELRATAQHRRPRSRSKLAVAAAIVLGAALAVPVLGEAWRSWQQQRDPQADIVASAKGTVDETRGRTERSPASADARAPAAPASEPPAATTEASQPSQEPVPSQAAAREAPAPTQTAGRRHAEEAATTAAIASSAALPSPTPSMTAPAPSATGNERAPSAAAASLPPAVADGRSATRSAPARRPQAQAGRRAADRMARAKVEAPSPASLRAGAVETRKPTAAAAGSRNASRDTAKSRTASAMRPSLPRGSGALLPRVANASSAKPSALAPAPKPWPHTAMANGMSAANRSVDRSAGASAPASIEPARTASADATPVLAPSPPSTAALPSATVPLAPAAFHDAAPIDFSTRARALLANDLPRIAQRAERSVLRVLFAAVGSDDAMRESEVRRATALMRQPPDERLLRIGVAPGDAQSLNDAARSAQWQRGRMPDAAELQLRAFGANPLDPEIAGNLARMRLRQRPPQAESARQLALHALTLPDAGHPHGRLEDWTSLAIASALAGRERDAVQAWLVTIALAPSVHRQCRVAADAYALYGERLRSSIESMLLRLQASGRTDGSPFCSWPPYWNMNESRTAIR